MLDQNATIVFACWLRGFQRFGEQMFRFPKNPELKVLLTGNPPASTTSTPRRS